MEENLDNLTDFYLSRSLKNWSAAQQWRNRHYAAELDEARARLLALAATIQPERPVSLFQARFWWNRRLSFYPDDPFWSGPFTQSRIWSQHPANSSFVFNG